MRDGHEIRDESRMDLERSPIHRAIWEEEPPVHLFAVPERPMSAVVRDRLDRSIELVRQSRRDHTLYDEQGVVSDDVIDELAGAGYWGLRVPSSHGGAGGSFAALVRAMTEMVLADPWVAGMASTQAGLGPVSSLLDFGTPAQKQRLLPPLARGIRLGAFAITEPRASSDWGRMTMSAQREGDHLLLTGEKLFISNAAPGRTVSLLCWLDGRLEMVLVELPWREDEHFQIVSYPMRAPAHLRNAGLRFRDLPVPSDNLLVTPLGDGRAIGFRALNHGRAAICALSAGMLRRIAGSLIPWVQQRETFGSPIGARELVQRRLGQLASRIVACDALASWAATLLDDGYRGELECITAKVFASEAVKEAAVDILLKTHGGRAFVAGNQFADGVFDMLAPTIYEGENEIITLGFMNRLARAHAARYLAPIADGLRASGYERTDLADPRQMWAVRRPLATYAAWVARREAHQMARMPHQVPTDLDGLADLGRQVLHGAGLEISRLLRAGPPAAEHQAAMHEIGLRVQRAVVLQVVSQYAARQSDPLVRTAGLCMAMELGQALLGRRPSSRYQRLLVHLGGEVADDRFAPVASAPREPVAMLEKLAAPEQVLTSPLWEGEPGHA